MKFSKKRGVIFFFLIFMGTFFMMGFYSIQAQEVEYSVVVIDNPNPRPRAFFGAGVAGSDDINSDGVPDLLVAAVCSPDPGQVFVFSGKDFTLLLTIDSPSAQTRTLFGECLTSVDDINGDEIPDILIGDQSVDVEGNENQGQAYIFSGADGILLRTIDVPNPGPRAWFGWGLCRIGDIDGDTIGDYVIPACGQYGDFSNRGKVFLFSGLSGGLIRTIEIPDSESFGEWTADLGDINGDGISDLLIGDRFWDAGRAFIFSGADGNLLLTLDNPNPQSGDEFGFRLDGAGDVNGDGIPDMIVGATNQEVEGYRAGQAFVLSGFDGSLLLTLDNPNPQDGGSFGWSVAGVGDVDIDGVPDMLVSAPYQNVGDNRAQGRAFLFSGGDGSLLKTLNTPNPQPWACFGEMVAGVGDLNDDGMPDLLIGAYEQNVGGNQYQGQAFLFLSIVTPEQATLQLINDVERLVDEGKLLPDKSGGLIGKLEEALKALDKARPNIRVACNKLSDFIDQVNSCIQSGAIPDPADGQALIDAANAIINELCG
jgi:hypothetical protein